MMVPELLRRARLQALMARQLVNWREAWGAYSSASPMPSLRFRNGLVFHHGPRDSAGFLFFEIFANGCYRRGLPVALHTPSEVKAAVTGSGRADKAQVTTMVMRLKRSSSVGATANE